MRIRTLALGMRGIVGVVGALLLIGPPWGGPAALGQAASQPAAAPAPIRVWNSDIHDNEFGVAPGGAPSITIVAARNGAFSGKVMVGSDAAIQGLKAAMSDLKCEGPAPAGGREAAIPAGSSAVRYGVQWDGGIPGSWGGINGPDILLEAPLPEFPLVAGGRGLVAVWVTVRVPKGASPGAYAGRLTIEAKGGPPVAVPIRLEVQDWTLPEPQDYRIWTEIIEQPDTLAAEYKLPLWSEKHWEMIAKSLRTISPTGSRVVYVPLIARTNYGSDDSMVRWIKKADGKYDYDYSLMEKYLDAVQKNLGTPKIVGFIVWDVYLALPKQAASAPIEVKGKEGDWEWKETTFLKSLQERAGKGPPVSVLDPTTQKTEQVLLPRYDSAGAAELWRPLWEGIRTRMKARGLEGAMMLAQSSDRRPAKEEVAFWNDLSGGLPWMSCTHNAVWQPGTKDAKGRLQGTGTIAYADVALEHFLNLNPEKGRYYGWQEPLLRAQYWRMGYFNMATLSSVRSESEVQITGRQRGVGHIGGDFWRCLRNKSGKRTGTVTDRFPESYWHSLNVEGWLLAPGPDGPVGTARLEAFREGLQECEARIAIESALTDPARKAKLGEDLAKRAQEMLDERLRCIWKGRGATDADFEKYGLVNYTTYGYDIAKAWGTTRGPGHKWWLFSGWAERAGRLFSLAGEVAGKLAPRSGAAGD